MTTSIRDLESVIRRFLGSELGVDDAALDTPLVAAGLVDSVGLVRLATLVERQTGIRIPDRDITPEKFGSIERILAYVSAKTRP
ncbi:MAG: acyl carrier protein [Deltaproteobacteria bacterium]|nr:MAG: acyl carrier protein [Deltaproteobacteria bacterium]TMA55068.1 MAG: acyl carrier protein [Deltaproteobacteria bacterium]